MTRDEEIEQVAKDIARKFYNEENPNIAYRSVRQGILWADQHPSTDTVKKIICYALKRTNIMLAEDLENGVEWELLIKQAMKGEQQL
jgi:hypothetical protein